MLLGGIRAVVFDVLGTVVDEPGTVRRESGELFEAFALPQADLPAFLDDWEQDERARMDAVCAGEDRWANSEAIRLAALREQVRSRGWEVPEPALVSLASVGHRLDPWPDSVEALQRLSRTYPVVALTNGSFPQMTDTFVHAGLRWTLVLSADLVRTFKPAAAMYQLPVTHLELTAEQMLFVAAHPWDLDAAASHGYRTALIRRPGTDTDNADRFDLSTATIGELADLVAA